MFGFFPQARIVMDSGFVAENVNPQAYQGDALNAEDYPPPPGAPIPTDNLQPQGYGTQDQGAVTKEECFKALDELKNRSCADGTDKETNFNDGDASCLATCTTSDIEDDPFKGSFTYEVEAEAGDSANAVLTSCVGTRWFRAPELLYGSTQYSLEIDLWSLGCVFAELFTLEPLFPGTSDIDQLGRIMDVLGNLNEEVSPGCSRLPDYKMISFNKVENPMGIEARMLSRAPDEIALVKKLVSYDPAKRATAMELLQDKYFTEEPLPVPISELWVPLTRSCQDEDNPAEWYDYNGMGSDSDDEDFGPMKFTSTSTGFSIQFH